MKQYLDVLNKIISTGVEKQSARENMPNTIGISHATIDLDLQKGFPLLTTKKMYWKGIVHELLWFLRGETNIKYLVDNNVNIWNGDAYRWYLKFATLNGDKNQNDILHDNNDGTFRVMTEDEFINRIKKIIPGSTTPFYNFSNGPSRYYSLGDLGKVYGYQWRNQNGFDQVSDVIDGLKNNPLSRYHIINGWNKSDFSEMALPPCHLLYQFIVRPMSAIQREDYVAKINNFSEESRYEMNPNATDEDVHRMYDNDGIPKYYLDMNMYQRSCDSFLGLPFNLASMSLLLKLFAKTCGMVEGIAYWIGGDVHLYLDHLPMAEKQLQREPFELCNLIIKKDLNTLDDILSLTIDDFVIENYISHESIKAELFTGNKK